MNCLHVMTHERAFTARPMLSTMKTEHLNYKAIILLFPVVLMEKLKSWASGVKPQQDIKKSLENSLNIKDGLKMENIYFSSDYNTINKLIKKYGAKGLFATGENEDGESIIITIYSDIVN